MLLGLLAVGALWVIGVGQALSRNGSWTFATFASMLGGAMVAIGLYQSEFGLGEWQWLVRVLHTALGLLTIGLGHMGAARYRKQARHAG